MHPKRGSIAQLSKKTRTDLPDSLLEELQGSNKKARSKSFVDRDNRLDLLKKVPKKISVLNRKELRKQKRLEKKGRKNQVQSQSNQKATTTERSAGTNERSDRPTDQVKKPKLSKDSKLEPKEKVDSFTKEKRQLENFSKSNPELYERLIQSNLIQDSSRKPLSKKEDDEELARYRSLLKLRKGGKKLPKSFEQDGLGDLLGDLETFDEDEDQDGFDHELDVDLNEDSEMDEELVLDNQDEDYSSEGEDQSLNAEDVDDKMEGYESAEMSEDNQVDESESDQESQKKEIKDTPAAPTPGKYVPPHLRKLVQDESQIRLQRQLKGLINKLSDTNLESILNDVEGVYQSNSRRGNALVQLVSVKRN
jgi:nucleolar MIF4G domain-containing protein 1